MKRIVVLSVVLAAALMSACLSSVASAASSNSGVQHLTFHAGPYLITPGANLIQLERTSIPKPTVDGYVVKMSPNLRYALRNGKCCGKVPRVDVIHLHHGVWLSNGAAGQGEGAAFGGFYPFMAAGEEKTTFIMPPGYGYPVKASDIWFLNYMIHDLTATPAKVYVTYNMDFVPATAPAAQNIKPVHPIWMDVERGSIYPVFDVQRFSGRNGKFTFPDMANNPYGSGSQRNMLTVSHPGTLVATAGHVHPGGLYDTLDLIRAGATPSGGAMPGSVPNSVRLFRSDAHYFDRRGPISWDMSMGATAPDWRPQVNAGDVLRVTATYETKRASWYEVMGIMVVWEAWNDTGTNPFTGSLDESEHLTHGHLPENNHHGGTRSLKAKISAMRDCRRSKVLIAGFKYLPGDFTARGRFRCVPTVTRGKSLEFINEDADPLGTFNLFNPSTAYLNSIFHSVTSCQNPCGLDTGISYPLANGAGGFDSGQLGAGTPAVGVLKWDTPTTLKPGTYTYFCRIHPFMRGVFRVIG